MAQLLFIFLDGVGIGDASDHNPFFAAKAEFLPFYSGNKGLPDGTPVKAIDAMLGVEGLPQSATGQTSLYTGENAPAALGEHKGSYPNKWMRKTIKEKNILSRLRAKNINAGFINAYPFYSELFSNNHVDIDEDGGFHFSEDFPPAFKRRISATTCMMIANRLRPFDENDIIKEKAIYQDFPNHSLNRMMEKAKAAGKFDRGVKEKITQLPLFTPEKAGQILARAFSRFDFLLYEYFQTDIYGHRSTFDERVELIQNLNRLVGKVISLLDKNSDTLLITSDHGNLEDADTRTHTRGPVPLVVWGHRAEELRNGIHSLVDVAPAIENFFN